MLTGIALYHEKNSCIFNDACVAFLRGVWSGG